LTARPPTGRTSVRLLLVALTSIFLAEALVMGLLTVLPPLAKWSQAVVDAVLLTLLIFPVLYFSMLRPLLRADAALRRGQEELEGRVEERTRELANASRQLARSVEGLERSNREVTLLGEMVDLFQACRTTQEANDVIARCASRLFSGVSGALYVFRAPRNLVERAASWGRRAGGDGAFAPDQCWALRRGRPHVVEAASPIVCSHLANGGPAAALCLPMMAQGEALDVLVLRADGPAEPGADLAGGSGLEGSLRLARAASEHIALALANLRLRETLKGQAIRDPLTGLFNRRYMEETQEPELRRAERRGSALGIVMFDIDHFKLFNDTHGHEAGDLALREMGAFLLKHVRGEDIACRYGGEEFALILPDASLAATKARAEGLREAVKNLLLGPGVGSERRQTGAP